MIEQSHEEQSHEEQSHEEQRYEEQRYEEQRREGLGFIETLLIVFITLKVIGVITVSWIWVFSPLWLPLALLVAMMTLAVLIAFFLTIFEND